MLMGALRDATGTFLLPIWILVILTGAMLALTSLLQPHKRSTAVAVGLQEHGSDCDGAEVAMRKYP
jgi:hypothetical protein